MDMASSTSLWHPSSPNSQITYWLLRSVDLFMQSMWSVAMLASASSTLAWEEVSTGRGGASDLWGGDMTASTVADFPTGECYDSWLDSSTIT